ncbi:hypothetical protein PO124_25650 [Bacillus licheniformis]|nr:hypothetical protein [Bacillus licheniformis]
MPLLLFNWRKGREKTLHSGRARKGDVKLCRFAGSLDADNGSDAPFLWEALSPTAQLTPSPPVCCTMQPDG